jgi:hypothetical protein
VSLRRFLLESESDSMKYAYECFRSLGVQVVALWSSMQCDNVLGVRSKEDVIFYYVSSKLI